MKKILGKAIAMIALATGIYFAALFMGLPQAGAAFAAFVSVFSAMTFAGANDVTYATASFALVASVFAAFPNANTVFVFVATVFFAFFAVHIAVTLAAKLSISWRHVLAVHAAEVAAISSTLYLVALWPALLGVAVLGAWLAAIYYRERRQRLAAT